MIPFYLLTDICSALCFYIVLPVYTSWWCFCDAYDVKCLIKSVLIPPSATHHVSWGYTNKLLSSFRQPHCVHSPPGSPHPVHITSSQSPPSLSPSITPSAFHSRHKTTYSFLHSLSDSLWTAFVYLESVRTKFALAFLCFSCFFSYIFFWLSVLD